ncbi:MAG: hypothetical protein HY875_09000, partial [Chloroflexi bacterium]|nr:hypothetical protein [Chloroflexota bacterium]
MTLALRGKSRRRKALLILSAVIAVVVAAFGGTALRGNWSAAAADPLPSSIQLYQWETGGGSWVTGNLGAHNSSYAEGETVPFRLDVSGVPLGQYTFPVCRDYSNGTEFGYNFHTPFETTETTTHGAITSTLGNFSAEGATVDIVAGGNTQGVCNADHRETTVTITITAATAFVYFGGHLAAPTDPGVGFGNGASQYPGSSLHMDIEGKDRSINPASIGVLWIVNKDFTDNNSANVTVSLQCTGTGTSVIVLDNTASEADPADFNVFGATSTVTCTATEVVPAGYTADESDCLAVPVGDGTCTIVNTPSTRQITVKKVRAGLASGDVTFAGTISNGPDSAFSILTNANGQFGQDRTVDLQSHTVVETPVPAGWTLAGYKTLSGLNADCVADTSGYTSSGNVIPASSASYTVCVKNTYNTGTFEVVKDFVPNAGGTVTVGLVCASGSVVNDDTSASEADPANFTVNGYSGDPLCTATESAVPAGYSSTGTCSALLSVGTCTITNTLNTDTFEVVKDFSDNSTASVTVGLVCASGSVVNDDVTASEADPANFTVNGYSGDPLCTATESAVPAGYTSTGTCSALLSVGTCTIVNTLRTDGFVVLKDFVPDAGGSVTVGLVCGSGSVVNDDVTASEADPANFTVNGYSGDPLCTATESAVPAGYSSTGTCSALLSVGTCTIV